MNKILDSIAPVIQKARHVRINDSKLVEFCDDFRGFETSFVAPTKAADLSTEDKLQLDFAYNAANFCYWGYPHAQWFIEHQGREVHGAYGMKAAFNRALEKGTPLLDPSFLENLTEGDLAKIVKGGGYLLLFDKRLEFLRQFGRVLNAKYDGKATNVVEAAKGDAIRLVDELTSNSPCYDDSVDYDGNRVLFHKRAQLLTHNVHTLLQKQGKGLARTTELTALADYKVPQILRHVGILEYSPTLVAKIDAMVPIQAGSQEEVEIRAFTLEACERMVGILRQRHSSLEVIDLDHWLYHKSKEPGMQNSKPYHRTLTTAY